MSKAAQVQALTKAPISSFASTAFSRDSPNQAYDEACGGSINGGKEQLTSFVTSVRHIDRDKHQKKKQDPPKLGIQYKSSMKSCAPHISSYSLPSHRNTPTKTVCKIIDCPCHASCARWSNMYLVLGSNCSNSCGCMDVGHYTHRIGNWWWLAAMLDRVVNVIWSNCLCWWNIIWWYNWYNILIPWNSCLKCSCCSSSLGWVISPSGQPARVVNAILAMTSLRQLLQGNRPIKGNSDHAATRYRIALPTRSHRIMSAYSTAFLYTFIW